MSRFKTELCNNLIELGSCKYGDRCHYAHGAHELRQVSRRHPKYRTEKCKNFEMTGKCPFGPRCSYVHPKPDFESMLENLAKYLQYTRAPKPDSEDLDDSSLPLTRTNTNTSLSAQSTCNSITFNSDEDKENQFAPNYEFSNQINKQDSAFSKFYTIDNPFAIQKSFCQARDFHSTVSSPLKAAVEEEEAQKATPAAAIATSSLHINPDSKHEAISSSSINILTNVPRTPLSSNNFSNQHSNSILTHSATNESNYNLYAQMKDIKQGCSSNNLLAVGPSSRYEGNYQRVQPKSTSNNPFAIKHPFSDHLNSSNLNRRSPLQPNKQYLTRF